LTTTAGAGREEEDEEEDEEEEEGAGFFFVEGDCAADEDEEEDEEEEEGAGFAFFVEGDCTVPMFAERPRLPDTAAACATNVEAFPGPAASPFKPGITLWSVQRGYETQTKYHNGQTTSQSFQAGHHLAGCATWVRDANQIPQRTNKSPV
jgi:hypothetical protein